ncbi:hypothetical protein SAMN04488516_102126 [Desulfonauticus submarinus]|uniref:Hybrid cluster protein-associated redox disulfide domain-containing protein n=1 Tax=Desulfonauticus submarinus TaxID=206665 RepID=A0A1H0BCU3_9BACT|nr:hypothetical protein [Desulfonauticus submarinus]SDN43459.1 hypothetical protein SAMN04488516_102126 [Desulfonauticus submarinus]
MEIKDILNLTLLDIVSENKSIEQYFRQLGEELGVCLLCKELFTPLEMICKKYKLDCSYIIETIRKISSN